MYFSATLLSYYRLHYTTAICKFPQQNSRIFYIFLLIDLGGKKVRIFA